MKKKHASNIDVTDPVIDKVERLPAKAALKTAPSLKPGVAMVEAAAFGQPEAVAIRDAWRFQTTRATRIIVVNPADFIHIVERGSVTFGG